VENEVREDFGLIKQQGNL